MKRAFAIAGVLAALSLGLWILVRGTGVRDGRATTPTMGQSELESGGATRSLIPAEIGEPVAEVAERTEVTAPEPVPIDEAVTANANEPAGLQVFVLDLATGEPVPGLGGSLGPLEGREGWLRSETQKGGRLEFTAVPMGVPRLLEIKADFVSDALASLELASFEPGELRELTLEVDASVIPAYWFRCVAYEDGRPLAGVRVWRFDGARGASGGTPWRRGQPAGVSDHDGLVRLSPAFGGSSLVFELEGLAPGFAELWAAGETSRGAAEIPLAAPARLEIRLRRTDGSRVTGQAVLVRAEAGELGLGMMTTRAVMGPRMQHRLEFTATTDAAGLAVFPGLPALAALENMTLDRPVAVVVGLPEDPDASEAGERGFSLLSADPVRLAPGETRAVEFIVGGAAHVTGVVVDQVGAPVAGQELWLLRAGAEPRIAVDTEDGLQVERSVHTDERGGFELGSVSLGRWELFVAAERWMAGSVLPDAVAPSGVGFEVEDGTGSLELRLIAHRGLAVTGRVLRADGDPVPFCVLSAKAPEIGFSLSTAADNNGVFSVGPLIEADYELTIHPGPWGVLQEPVHARPGDDVELRLIETSSIRGRLVAEPNPLEMAVQLQCYPSPDGGPPGGGMLHFINRPEFIIEGLAPGEYTIVARAGDARIAISAGHTVLAGERLEGVEIRLREGGTLRVRCLAPEETAYVLVVRVAGQMAQVSRILGGDTLDLAGPAGRVALEVWEAGELTRSLPLTIIAVVWSSWRSGRREARTRNRRRVSRALVLPARRRPT